MKLCKTTDCLLLVRIFRGHYLHQFRHRIAPATLHRVLDEVERIAAATGFPHLVLPLLAEESLRHAAEAASTVLGEAQLSACA